MRRGEQICHEDKLLERGYSEVWQLNHGGALSDMHEAG
jgi:hypothetical protein